MLLLNTLLMLASTGAALHVLVAIYPTATATLPALLSIALNFAMRGNDVINTTIVYGIALALGLL